MGPPHGEMRVKISPPPHTADGIKVNLPNMTMSVILHRMYGHAVDCR